MSRITVYTRPGCVQCTATCGALDGAGLEYTVVDLSADATAMSYVTVDDHGHWSGFTSTESRRPSRCAHDRDDAARV